MPTWQVGQSSDDCLRRLFNVYWSLTNPTFGAGSNSPAAYRLGAGARFTNITIPRNSTITRAYLTLRAASNQSGTVVKTRISAERIDQAPTFADNAVVFGDRWATRTITKVDWDNIGPWSLDNDYDSPDISAVIQEVVDGMNWASGNAIVIFWEDFEDRSTHVAAFRSAYSWDGSAANAPRLVIEYTDPTISTIIRRPNAAGDFNVLGDFNNINDDPIDDATYLESEATPADVGDLYDNNYAVYHIAASGLPPGTIISQIEIFLRARSQDTATRDSAKAALRTGGTSYGLDGKTVEGGFINYSTVVLTNPNTGVAWTIADIDDLQIGLALRRCQVAGANMRTYCSELLVEITHSTTPTAQTDLATEVG